MKLLSAKTIFLLSLLLAVVISGKAQVSITLKMDTNQIFIGEQVLMKLKVSAPSNAVVIVPQFPDSVLTDGVEVLEHYRESTASFDGGRRQTLVEAYRITSFDSALYYIPPLEVQVGDSIYKSKTGMALKVISPDVDTTKVDKFYGPKENAEVYYDWSDLRRPFLLWLLGVVLLLAAAYMAIQIKNNHRILPKLKLHFDGPPHKWAMRQIEKLKGNRPTEPEEAHRYYAGLTDIVRTYIDRRYGFKATAMTSAQIIDRLQGSNDPKLLSELQEMFVAAVLVKYAGIKADIDENDRNLLIAIEYVNATKETEAQTKRSQRPKEEPKVRRSRQRRTLLVCVNVAVAAAGIALFTWAAVIMYNMYY
ncbi:MAG: hypothetical protein J5678_02335 [Bacteroidaceae bacterium]|nr:hypothetical protein [Bacteroidaceae bacterium]